MVRKREITIGATLLIIATLAFLFGWTNLFTVHGVSVSGSPNSDITKQVLYIADIKNGEKLARIEPRNISSKLALAGIDWVENVKVSRNWLSRKVDISLQARVAVAKAGAQFIDAGGNVFTSPVEIKEELATISSLNASGRSAAINFYLNLPKDFKGRTEKIVATSPSNFQILLKNNLRIIWGANSNNQLKVKIYKALIALPENKKIKVMDVSDPTKPTVK